MNKVRAKAWATRREKYGPSGHRGSYHRASYERQYRLMEEAIIRLYCEGVLSEGQAAAYTGLDRIALRTKADDLQPLPQPPTERGEA